MNNKKNKNLLVLVLIISVFLTNKTFAEVLEKDVDNNMYSEEIPVIEELDMKIEKIEEGTKIINTIKVRSETPIRFISRSFDGPDKNIYGGGHGVKFNKVGENLWEYRWWDIVSKYAPSGIYKYTGIKVENESFKNSEVWSGDHKVEIDNDMYSEEIPVIEELDMKIEKIEEGTKIINTIKVRSETPIRYISRSFDGPDKNIYGGGHGVKFNKVGENLWEYRWWDIVSKYAPSGIYKYTGIKVENESFKNSEVWSEDHKIEIDTDMYSEEIPIIEDLDMEIIQVGQGIKLINTIKVRSETPIRFISRSFDGPDKNIYGGGHGVKFNKVGENLWEYRWWDIVSKYAPSGTYKYTGIKVENESFKNSEVWGKEHKYYYDDSIFNDFIPVSGLNVSNKEITMSLGNRVPLKYSIEPDNATNKDIIISNNYSEIIDIDDGKIFAKKEGYANILIKTVDGEFKEYINIRVIDNNRPEEPERPERPWIPEKPEIPDRPCIPEIQERPNVKEKPGMLEESKKIEDEKTGKHKIILKIGDLFLIKDGKKIEMDTSPIIKNNRTILPIRFIIESIGGDILWDGLDRKVTILKDDTVIELWIGSKEIKVNGETKHMDIAPEIINNRTYVPIRFIIENIPGYEIEWNKDTREVLIKYLSLDII